MFGSELIKTIIKDVTTVKNGEDFCIAGLYMTIALPIGIGILFYGLYEVEKIDLKAIGQLLKDFGTFCGIVVSTGCAGKAVKNNAEPE